MISKASRISNGLILYNFNSKENLYKQVIEKKSAHYLNVITGQLETDAPIDEAMKKTLAAAFDFWKNDKNSLRLGL
jgi:hypothetical protein